MGTGPLSGKRILITRARNQAAALTEPLNKLGAETIIVPTIEIVPPLSFAELDQAIDALDCSDFLVLTSVNAVNAFFNRLRTKAVATTALAQLQLIAVGPKTAEAIAAYGIEADLIPAQYRAEGIVALLKNRVAGKRVLYPKAALARDLIPMELSDAGAEVVAPVAYASAPPTEAKAQLSQALNDGLDLLTFTASSTVRNFVELLTSDNHSQSQQIPVASIGPLTTATAKEFGFKVVAEPKDSTLDDMIIAIQDYFGTL